MDPFWLYNAETDPNPDADPDAGNKKCLTVNKNSCKVNLEIYKICFRVFAIFEFTK